MVRLLFFIVLLFAVGFAVQGLSSLEGVSTFEVYGYQITATTPFVLVVLLLLALAAFLLGQLWAFLVQAPHTLEKWRDKKRYQEGFDHFLLTLESFREGDFKGAQKHGKKSQKLLPHPALKDYLGAELAVFENTPQKALPFYEDLSKRSQGSWVGLMGMMEQFSRLENWEKVHETCQQAFAMRPKNKKVVDKLLQAQFQLSYYDDLLKLLPHAQKYSSYTSEFLDDVESMIYYEKFKVTSNSKDQQKFLKKSLQASAMNFLSFEQTLELETNDKKKLKLLNDFFKKCPSLEVYKLWQQTIKGQPNQYYKRRLKAFLKGHEGHFVEFYVQAHEAYRLDHHDQCLEFCDKGLAVFQSQQLLKLKMLSLQALEKHDEVTLCLEKLADYGQYIFIGDYFAEFASMWQMKDIFEKQNHLSETKQSLLLTHG